jgi:two-component system chemotaxis sensor kinase CheA
MTELFVERGAMSSLSNEMDDIIKDFIAESSEALDSLDQRFVDLEKNPGDSSLLNEIFRAVHTIKGAAGFLGFQQMVEVTHATEDVLNKLRKGELGVDASIMDAVLQAVDLIKLLLRNIKEKNNKTEETGRVISALSEAQKGGRKKEPETAQAATDERPRLVPSVGPAPPPPPPSPGPGDMSAVPGGVPGAPPEAHHDARPTSEPPKDAAPGRVVTEAVAREREKEHSIRVDIERVDSVLNLAGELVLARNRLTRLGSRLGGIAAADEMVGQVDEAISQLSLVTTDLQLAVMMMRMQPIARVFNRFPRMVRDLARQNGKEVELVMSGEDTELDKTVIEEIGDPLVHLIRNAVDHGIEPREERLLLGKSACGSLRLAAYQEGRHIFVSVSDDGRGIDPAHIKRTAIEKGLLTAEEADIMQDKEALNLIFIPGFSTVKKTSSLSGRGVGMDVVKTNVSRINGTITIDSAPGKGTSIVFKLPLTLAIIQVLTVEARGEVYGIPLSTVVENIRIRAGDVKTVEGRQVIQIRDRVYPVVRLEGLIGGTPADEGAEWSYVVVIETGERVFGLLVDRLHGQEEIVMKSMGEYLRGIDGIAGACINGDGNVILILDVAALIGTGRRVCVR